MLEGAQQLVDGVRAERVEHVGAVEGDPDGAVRLRAVVGQVGQVLEPGTSSQSAGSKMSLTPSIALMGRSLSGAGILGAVGVVRGMTLQGTYVPSKADWVREQVEAFEASDGAEANTLRDSGDPIVVITSVGAKSGNLRKNPVMRVERDGMYVAIASKGGADDQPEWYYNFVAASRRSTSRTGRSRRPTPCRLLEGDERTDLWEPRGRTWSTYAEYQKKTEREIPVFKLTPSTETSGPLDRPSWTCFCPCYLIA